MQEQSTNLCDTKYKIVFLGNMGVGKTSIIQRFVKDDFDQSSSPTVGIDFLTRNFSFQNKTYRLQLWDTAGQEKYKSLVPAYLRDANCAVFVFDFTKRQTFHDLTNWIQLYRDHASQLSVAFLIGNKSDLIESQQAQSPNSPTTSIQYLQDEATKFAKRQKMIFLKVSAKTGNNVMTSFENIIIQLQRGNKKKQNPIMNNAEQEFEKQVLEKMDKLRLGDIKRGKQNTSCCYI